MSESTGPAPSPEQSAQESQSTQGTQGCACGGKGPALSQMLRMMMPSEAAHEHFRNAGLEFLKGFRELLDQRIQTLSQAQNKGTKVNVE